MMSEDDGNLRGKETAHGMVMEKMSPQADPAERESKLADRLLGLVVLVAVLPMVLDTTHKSIPVFQLLTGHLGNPDEPSTRINIVLPLILVMFLVGLVRPGPSLLRPLPLIVIALIVQFTVSAGWGVMHGAGVIGVVFFVQTIVPLIAWLAAYRISPSPKTLGRAVMIGVLFTAVVAVLFTAFHGGLGNAYFSSIQLEGPIPQYRSYFLAVAALGAAIAVASLVRDRWLSIATIVGSLALVPLSWSRAGILMIIVAIAGSAFWTYFRGRTWRQRSVVAVGLAAVFGALAVFTVTVGLVSQRGQQSDLAASDTGRVELAQESTKRVVSSPLTGDSFHAYSKDLVGGGVATFDRLFPSHNQYLDYGLRGGVLAVGLLVVFLVLTTWSLFRRWRSDPPEDLEPLIGAGLGFMMALVPAALTELYISQTWSGVVIMLFYGALARLIATQAQTAQN